MIFFSEGLPGKTRKGLFERRRVTTHNLIHNSTIYAKTLKSNTIEALR